MTSESEKVSENSEKSTRVLYLLEWCFEPEIRTGKDIEKRSGVLREDNRMSFQPVVIDKSSMTFGPQLGDQPNRMAPCDKCLVGVRHAMFSHRKLVDVCSPSADMSTNC